MLTIQANAIKTKIANEQAATQRMFKAFRGRNHAEVDAALKDGADPNAKDANGNPAIFAIDPADTHSLVLLYKAGANMNAKNAQGFTLLQTLSDTDNFPDTLSEITPMLRAQLYRINLLLAAKANIGHLASDLADHWGKLMANSIGKNGNQYLEAIDMMNDEIKLVKRISREGDKVRPTLDELFPSPQVNGKKEQDGTVSKTKQKNR